MRHTILLLTLMLINSSNVWSIEPSIVAEKLGMLTLLPTLLAIILAFITKRVYFSLFLGIWAGTFLLSSTDGVQLGDFYQSFDKIILTFMSVLSDSWSASIIAQVITIGGLIAVIGKNGGSFAIAEAIAKKAKSARSAQLLSCFTSLFIFFDDYANCLITGPVMQPVTDKLKVSREKLSFIIDSTAAPIAGIALISTWIGYELGLIRDAYTIAGIIDPNPYEIFIATIPYRFYNLFMLGFVVLIALINKDFGPMLSAEQRARQTGVTFINNSYEEKDSFLDPEPNIKHRMSNAIIPILVLIIGSFVGIWYSGHKTLMAQNPDFASNISIYKYILEILGASDVILEMFKASFLASIVAIILSAATKTMTCFHAIDVWVSGAKNLLNTVLVLLLAWSISSIIKELGTNIFLAELLKKSLNPSLIPTLTFALSSFIAFSTGTSFATMGMILPLAVPLAATLSGDPNSFITLVTAGSVLSGAIVGDHCSPISDTTILSSSGAGCSLIDHVNTQLPYSMVVAGISIFFGYFLIALNVSIIWAYIFGFLGMALTIWFIGKNPDTTPIKTKE